MLEKIELVDFKAFSKYTVKFDSFNLMIGKNNNGKSTVIDGLKLISSVMSYKNLIRPQRIDSASDLEEEIIIGYKLEESKINIILENVKNDFDDNKDSVIKAYFKDGFIITVIIPKKSREVYFYFFLNKANIDANRIVIPLLEKNRVFVVPNLGSFEPEEQLKSRAYIDKSYGSHLSSSHFRNYWYFNPENFGDFQNLLSKTWSGIIVDKLPELFNDIDLRMYYREERMTREIGWAGNGLAIWMQLITHVVKSERCPVLVVDEPEIYLHSDLQRKIKYLLSSFNKQIIIASHSIELINEVEPTDMIEIDKKNKFSKRIQDIIEVQRIVEELGSIHNLQLTKLIQSRKCLFFEGNDFKIFSKLAEKLDILNFQDGQDFTVVKLNGFDNVERLKTSEWFFKKIIGEEIKLFVVLDKDYRSLETVEKVITDFKKNKVPIHIWSMKEIENFLISQNLLYKTYQEEAGRKGIVAKSFEEFESLYEETALIFKEDIYGNLFSQKVLSKEIIPSDSRQVKEDRKQFEKNWQCEEERTKLLPGKRFISKINFSIHNRFKQEVSISIPNIIRTIDKSEISKEFKSVINRILKEFED